MYLLVLCLMDSANSLQLGYAVADLGFAKGTQDRGRNFENHTHFLVEHAYLLIMDPGLSVGYQTVSDHRSISHK